MASPQTQNGHVRIANELYDAILAFPFSKRELLIVLAVIRQTYGYSKKVARISNYQLSKMTGISKQHVSESIANLMSRQVLTVNESLTVYRGTPVRNIGINKDYETWSTVNDSLTVSCPTDGQQNGNGKRFVTVNDSLTMTVNKTGPRRSTKREPYKDNKRQKDSSSAKTLNFDCLNGRIPESAAREFIEHRKLKKAPLTQLAFDRAMKAAIDASAELGITAARVIEETIDAGWQGIKTEWLRNRIAGRNETSGGHRESRSERFNRKLREYAEGDGAEELDSGPVRKAAGPIR